MFPIRAAFLCGSDRNHRLFCCWDDGSWASGFGRAAFSSAEEVDGGAELEERIGGRLDAVDARDGVEDYVLLLHEAVGQDAGEFEGAELDELAIFRPVMGGVVGDVAGCGDLNVDLEADG